MVNVPGLGRQKINAAFNKGPQLVIDTLQQDFNVPINHYLEVNFKSFEDIVTRSVRCGCGLRIRCATSTPDSIRSRSDRAAIRSTAQTRSAYVRSRHPEYLENGRWVDASGRADIDRIERQQDFIKRLGRIAVQRPTDDPSIAPELADNLIPNLTADHAFDRDSFNELVRSFMGLTDGTGGGPIFETLPWNMGDSAGSYLTLKEPEADAVLAVLRGQASIPTTTTAPPATTSGGGGTTPAVRPVDVRVLVRNGSGVTAPWAPPRRKCSRRGL